MSQEFTLVIVDAEATQALVDLWALTLYKIIDELENSNS